MPSPPAFNIVVFQTLSPSTTPETGHYIAGLFLGYDAHARWVLSGPTADAAREKMETFWAQERKSYEPRQAPKKGQPAQDVEAAPERVSAVADDDGEVL